MPEIDVNKCKGHLDTALRRLKRLNDKLGIAKRLREIECHEKPTSKKRRLMAAAVKRQQKRNVMDRIGMKRKKWQVLFIAIF